MGDAPAPFTALVGCGTYLPRIALARMHMRAGENDAAVDLLRWCAAQHPEFFGTILPYADALLRTGSGSEAVLAEIESCVPAMTPTVRFRIGVALYEAGHAQAAEQQFRLVLGSKPHNGPARVALGEVLLRQRRYQEAAAEAALIDRDSPLAPIAARSEIFATILAEDYDGARAVLSGCADVGMPAAEVALFRSWLGQRTGELAPTYVPPSAWNLLGLMLDSLLRVQDFTSFETLLPVLAASGMPVRERRELLGCIYLRRGFLRSAAREWLAVVDEQPDARALLGLAQVAVAHGQPASARTFASHAVALDPGCVAASSILEALARSDAARVAS
jgi:tetratricopeptide (TPR) repeat protein